MYQYWGDARDFPSTVGTVCLPTRKMPLSEWSTVTGWGGTDFEASQSILLKEVFQILHKVTCTFLLSSGAIANTEGGNSTLLTPDFIPTFPFSL